MRRAAAGSHAAELGDDEKGKWPWFRVASRESSYSIDRRRSAKGVGTRDEGSGAYTRICVCCSAFATPAGCAAGERGTQIS